MYIKDVCCIRWGDVYIIDNLIYEIHITRQQSFYVSGRVTSYYNRNCFTKWVQRGGNHMVLLTVAVPDNLFLYGIVWIIGTVGYFVWRILSPHRCECGYSSMFSRPMFRHLKQKHSYSERG